MPIRDVEAQNASLDNDYGPNHGPASPDAHELALFAGDPMIDGTEITGLGYTPAAVSNDADWPDAAGGSKTRDIQMAAPTGEWDEADHWLLRDPVTGAGWDCAALQEPLNVTAASGTGPLITVQIFHADAVTDDL
jgi:hypothetical protein